MRILIALILLATTCLADSTGMPGTGGGGADPLAIYTDGTRTTTAQIPFALGLSQGSDTQFILDNDDALTRQLWFELATNRVELTNPEIGGKTKIHGYNRIELTTNSKSWTLLDAGSSIITFDIDFAGTTNIFDNAVTLTGGPVTASFMTASRPVVTDGSKNLVSGSVAAPILLTAGAFELDYNTTNLKLTASKLNTIQDIATTSAPTFLDLTLGDNSASDISITFDATNNGSLTWISSTKELALSPSAQNPFHYPGYESGYNITDIDNSASGRSAFQAWNKPGAASYPNGFWGGVYNEDTGVADFTGGLGLAGYNIMTANSAYTVSGDLIGTAASNEITGTGMTLSGTSKLIGLDVSGTSGGGSVTGMSSAKAPIGIRVNNNSIAGTDSYGIRFEKQTAGSTNNMEAFFVTNGGTYFRAATQKITSSAASTLDIDTATTGNLRVGGTAEYTWDASKFNIQANILDITTGKAEMPAATALPATCTIGEYFQDTDSNDCANTGGGDGAICVCKAANTWVLVANI